jgi:cytoskeleton protein RodZ
MSQSLGEKLRQAREDKGLTLSDVAEQTRISSLYLESIENDDYKILPGGIFNKGFVKSYAKFVGINEQEALMDYQAVLARSEGVAADSDQKVYRPEVLTDDRSGSMLPTILVAFLVLGLMTVGILYLVSYLRAPSSTIAANTTKPAVNTANEAQVIPTPDAPAGSVPDISSVKIDFRTVGQPVSLTATIDGNKLPETIVQADSTRTFEPKRSLSLRYSKSLASAVQLSINGKAITPPAVPLDPKRPVIEFEITKDNLAQIWTSGAIGAGGSSMAPANTNAPAATPKPSPKSTVTTNTAPVNPAVAKPAIQIKPTPKPTIIIIGTPKKTHE